ncbi:hypothetical protein B0O99DRAFT_616233 [Bisporella sp. PMI_857]|nr:hypothetical protein B0O99DRAFT_616233 [Bisporella sp. PMI_857]
MAAPAPTPKMSGQGMLYVVSKIASKDLGEAQYIKWYEEDHIVEIVETSGIKSALRYKNVDPSSADKPYMVTYPMEDIGFTQGEEFKNIKVHSDLLPGGGPIYDLVDIDVRYYGLIQKYDPNGPTKEGKVKTVMTAGLTPNDNISDQEFDDWYRTEHLPALATVPSYLRTTRYKLLYYRTNTQSRTLKGLPARAADLAVKEPPKFFAIHEFDIDDIKMDTLNKAGRSEWTNRILANLRDPLEVGMWSLEGSFGEKKFFQ